jgi:hypothetical protein
VHNKHQIITIICDMILIYQIAQCNDIGNGSGAEPYSFISLESHAGYLFANLAYEGCITEEIHSGLTVKKDELLEIEFDRGSCLFE